MNVIYALGIWEGGGLAYLADLSEDYFGSDSIYILDKRIKSNIKLCSYSRCYYFTHGFIGRLSVFFFRHCFLLPLFFLSPRGSVSEYFLNGIPSLSRLPLVSPKVYTLCQNKLFFDNKVLPEFNILYRMKLIALRTFFILSTRDTDTILVQTSSMQAAISSYFFASSICKITSL